MQIGSDHVEKYLNNIALQGASPATVERKKAVIGKFISWGTENGKIEQPESDSEPERQTVIIPSSYEEFNSQNNINKPVKRKFRPAYLFIPVLGAILILAILMFNRQSETLGRLFTKASENTDNRGNIVQAEPTVSSPTLFPALSSGKK